MKQGIRDEDLTTSLGAGSMRVLTLAVPEPSLEDQTADWERVERALAVHAVSAGSPDAASLESLSLALRTGGWRVRALCEESELLAADAEGSGSFHGFAVDLGTTTVDIALVDLETGERRGAAPSSMPRSRSAPTSCHGHRASTPTGARSAPR